MACSRSPAGASQAGFVLAVTLWLLAGIALVVGMVTLWSLDEVRDAGADRERLDERLAMIGTRDTVIYLAATRATTVAGLPIEPLDEVEHATRKLQEFGAFDNSPVGGELRLDGQVYQGLGGTSFAIQDESGLFSLTWPGDRDLDRFLAGQGFDRERIPTLRDRLLDYIDLDNLRRLQGAEEREYRQAKLPPPPNRRLLLPGELSRVIGWNELPQAQLQEFAELSTTFYGGALNLNTMPAALLDGVLPGCPETCDAFLARRAQQPFASSREIEMLLGVTLPGDSALDYRFAPSETMRLTLWGESGNALRIHVELAPMADQHAPWYVLAAYPVPRPPDATRQPEHATAQPTHSALFADPSADR